MHIGFFACFHAISLERSRFSKIATFHFHALVALKLLVSLISRLVACSARIVVDRQTERQTQTHRPTTVTLAAHARRGLMKGTKGSAQGGLDIYTRPLAIRMRYMCIYACAVLLIGGRAGPFYRFTDSWSLTSLLRVHHRVATLLDSTRESILALRYNFWRLQGTQSCSR